VLQGLVEGYPKHDVSDLAARILEQMNGEILQQSFQAGERPHWLDIRKTKPSAFTATIHQPYIYISLLPTLRTLTSMH
jgi:hypothetical protein